jgi:ABC-2 type transport system ATP-binding protein
MESWAVEASDLRKSFRDVHAVRGLNLQIGRGEVFGLLGPNGAGKTTSMEMLEGLVIPDSGEIRILGLSWRDEGALIRSRIGVQFQSTQLDDRIKVREVLEMFARFYPKARNPDDLLRLLQLEDKADAFQNRLSGGQRQRLALGLALVNDPELVFLDEPTTGLDPRSRRTMWEIVRELVADGTTIFLTTQYLEEADQLSDRIAVLDQGRLVAEGTPGELKRQVPGTHVRLRFADVSGLDTAARILAGAARDDQELTLRVPSDGQSKSLRALLDKLDEHAVNAEEFSVHTPDLDDVFLALTGHASTEATAS